MWNYKGQIIKDRTDLPAEAIGFVYKIRNLKTDKLYIGKKILLNKRTKPPLKHLLQSNNDDILRNYVAVQRKRFRK